MADTNAPTSSSYFDCFEMLKSTKVHRFTNRVNVTAGTTAYALGADSDALIMATAALIAVGSSLHTVIHGAPQNTEKTVQAYLLGMALGIFGLSLAIYFKGMVCAAESEELLCQLLAAFLAFYGVPAAVIALGSEASKKDESAPALAQTPAGPEQDLENPATPPPAATSASASTSEPIPTSVSASAATSSIMVLRTDADEDDRTPPPSPTR